MGAPSGRQFIWRGCSRAGNETAKYAKYANPGKAEQSISMRFSRVSRVSRLIPPEQSPFGVRPSRSGMVTRPDSPGGFTGRCRCVESMKGS